MIPYLTGNGRRQAKKRNVEIDLRNEACELVPFLVLERAVAVKSARHPALNLSSIGRLKSETNLQGSVTITEHYLSGPCPCSSFTHLPKAFSWKEAPSSALVVSTSPGPPTPIPPQPVELGSISRFFRAQGWAGYLTGSRLKDKGP